MEDDLLYNESKSHVNKVLNYSKGDLYNGFHTYIYKKRGNRQLDYPRNRRIIKHRCTRTINRLRINSWQCLARRQLYTVRLNDGPTLHFIDTRTQLPTRKSERHL